MGKQLYQEVVRVTRVYLGPAAERFIDRQIQNHLHKQPKDLSEKDLHILIDWIRAAMSLLTEDGNIVDEYTTRLDKLAAEKREA